mmetsp:Transcript_33277/g.56854  ORF Transcript_33277/g.56854 Transcript_33277/m.56854 type:complete len:102 (+) Transcript_33277:169-474(+)
MLGQTASGKAEQINHIFNETLKFITLKDYAPKSYIEKDRQETNSVRNEPGEPGAERRRENNRNVNKCSKCRKPKTGHVCTKEITNKLKVNSKEILNILEYQ